MSLITASGLCKKYQSGDITVEAIKDATFTIEQGSFVAFVGPSGSGKSTLLNMVGCLDTPSCGNLKVLDTDVSTLSQKEAAIFRGKNIGFVFQDFNLIPVLSAYENIEYPLIMVQDWPAEKRHARVMELLEAVGMADQAQKQPGQLSGGQKQRVAVARALVTQSQLVLADEPTANLDSNTAHKVIDLMKEMREKFGTTFIFSTHDAKVMAEAEITFTLVDGEIVNKSKEGAHV
ncbi:MAG: ABC transporter ATP-binding protein [Gammaproteobacteria bacterium]|nr:ABC transporter ATP-binding protein [Gammaproteobacteria bacterium]MCW8986288.1 ABC transporter ATP-binding protein [Gammaproteobacteria bacterium]